MLRGDIAQAARSNVLFLLLLPPLSFWAARAWWSCLRGRDLPRVALPRWCWIMLLLLLIAFGIVRNLDVEPLRWLAPSPL
jgi:hypothetical protein